MSRSTGKILGRVAYPLIMTLVIVGHLFMLRDGSSLLAGTYVPLTAAAVAVIVLEWIVPARREWRPRRSEVLSDAAFMVTVQMILPKALAFLFLVGVSRYASRSGAAWAWPHHWPVAAQAALMLLAADFLRYWLHRAAHLYRPLWVLHAVHHAPRKLYWLNVGRFHPFEKMLQLGLDALPFALLGVTEPVLALYFVIYATNGFLQHSNIALKLGVLNYVVSGPELHRWHHARDPRTARCNFGNNLILWDLVFGTRFLPKERDVAALGIPDRHYPAGFLGPMIAPFRRCVAHRGSTPSRAVAGRNTP